MRNFFLKSQLAGWILAACLLPWAAANSLAAAAYSFNENYSEIVDEYGFLLVNYSIDVSITVPLTNVDIGKFAPITLFEMRLVNFSLSKMLGEDPSYYRGKTSASFTNWYEYPETGERFELGWVALSWDDTVLTVNVTGTDYIWGTTINSVVTDSLYDGPAGSFSNFATASVRMDDLTNSRTVAYSATLSRQTQTVSGETYLLTSIQASGESDRTPPAISITSVTNNARLTTPLVAFSGTASDNAVVESVMVRVNDGEFVQASGTTNWTTGECLLRVGPNTVQVQAADDSGNVSLPSTITINYVLAAPFRARLIGQGTLSPNYDGQALDINQSYTMTATPTNGHRFDRWIVATNWGEGEAVLSNRLTFLMQSNLTVTAILIDTNRPTVQITNVPAGLRVSNAVFAVRGKAADNVAVSDVWWRRNSDNWFQAAGTAAWEAAATLAAGTNTLQVYSEDAAGNRSAVSNASVVYVVSDRLQIKKIGLGSFTPNYSNALLEIGRGYSMSATPTNGHRFDRWIVATNWGDGRAMQTNKLDFSMQSNLTLTVIFLDTNRPTVQTTNIPAGLRVSNAVFTARGKASDNVAVSNVFFRLNGSAWERATGTNVWQAPMVLTSVTNLFQTFAEDASGNHSTTNSSSFTYVMSDRLVVLTNGNGKVSPNYNGALLEIGKAYSMTATQGTGFRFTDWSKLMPGGSQAVLTNKAKLSFKMESNLVLVATFVDTQRPTVTISAPLSNARVSNEVYTVKGTATDNGKVMLVQCQVNNGAWMPAVGTNSWNLPVTLLGGTNKIRAFSVDAYGNRSLTNLVSCIRIIAGALGARAQGTNLQISITNSSRIPISLQFSSNLIQWLTLTNYSSNQTQIIYLDSTAAQKPQGFYRTISR